MKHLVIYGNGGSGNHGNEAILRGFHELFRKVDMTVYSYNVQADVYWGLSQIYSIRDQRTNLRKFPFEHICAYIARHLELNYLEMYFRFSPLLRSVDSNSIYLLEAGDQYCEPVENKIRSWYQYLNQQITKKGGKTVMMFCTIPKNTLDDPNLIEDLNRYSLIIARERITYNTLCNKNLKAKIIFSPCCAFLMKANRIELPDIYSKMEVVGITVGELAQNKEQYNVKLYEQTKQLIDYILKNTKYAIALIPHVHGGIPDDIRTSLRLEKEYSNPRVVGIDEHRADEQKYVISKCKLMITVRTHVSIAAYSSYIPTVVIGYSQKSVGIARDLFGSDEHYVIDIKKACEHDELIKAFQWLDANYREIFLHLKNKIPEYTATLEDARMEIEVLQDE